jgi:hypothetical protein
MAARAHWPHLDWTPLSWPRSLLQRPKILKGPVLDLPCMVEGMPGRSSGEVTSRPDPGFPSRVLGKRHASRATSHGLQGHGPDRGHPIVTAALSGADLSGRTADPDDVRLLRLEDVADDRVPVAATSPRSLPQLMAGRPLRCLVERVPRGGQDRAKTRQLGPVHRPGISLCLGRRDPEIGPAPALQPLDDPEILDRGRRLEPRLRSDRRRVSVSIGHQRRQRVRIGLSATAVSRPVERARERLLWPRLQVHVHARPRVVG